MKTAASSRKVIAPSSPVWGPTEFVDDVEQGGHEWKMLRLGIPTASHFSVIMAEGKDGDAAETRTLYLHRLAGERLTGELAEETFRSKAMDRGNEMEPEAREQFARRNIGVKLEQVGFMRRKMPSGRYVGASPDSLFDKRRSGLEVKTMRPDLMIPRLLTGAAMPPKHRWQCYGTMLVGGLERVTLTLFYRGMPVSPTFEVGRDERTIKELSNAIEVFDHELDRLVSRIKAMGGAR